MKPNMGTVILSAGAYRETQGGGWERNVYPPFFSVRLCMSETINDKIGTILKMRIENSGRKINQV